MMIRDTEIRKVMKCNAHGHYSPMDVDSTVALIQQMNAKSPITGLSATTNL